MYVVYPRKGFNGNWHITSLENFESVYFNLNKVTDIDADNAEDAVDIASSIFSDSVILKVAKGSTKFTGYAAICELLGNGEYEVIKGDLNFEVDYD